MGVIVGVSVTVGVGVGDSGNVGLRGRLRRK